MEISIPIFTGICIFVLLFSYLYQEKYNHLIHIDSDKINTEDEYYV